MLNKILPKSLREGFKNPNGFVVILIIIIFTTMLTWIVPSGEYDRIEDPSSGKTIVLDGSFHLVENISIGPFEMLKCIPKGIVASAGIIAFIFMISGSIQILRATGALDSGINILILKLKNKELLFLIIITFIFSLLGATIGFAEETIPFIPIGVAIATALGFDRVVGFHIVRTAAWVGFAGAFINPFTIGVAQDIAELPIFSGWKYRIFCYIIFITATIIFIVRYAIKIKMNPSSSILAEQNSIIEYKIPELNNFTCRQKTALLLFFISIILMFFGVARFGWYITELSALFFGFGLIEGLIGGMSLNRISSEFVKGMKDVVFGALIVGFARTIVIIMESSMILDTVIYGLSQPIDNFSHITAAVVMFIIQTFINFFIGSGSGQAAAVMPIIIPLSDVLGVTRQTSVLAYQFGDGITNMLWPSMVYYLSFADIPYSKWVKHILPLVFVLSLLGALLVGIASLTQYGPF